MARKPLHKTTYFYVILFGIFVAFSLCLQVFIPFLQMMVRHDLLNGNFQFLLSLVNQNFNLPMDVISSFWAAISAAYVGLDRAAFAIDALNKGPNTSAFNETKMRHLHQVLWMSFIIYALAVLLNTFFDAELALTPLLISFGSMMLLYVSGNKVVSGCERVKKPGSVHKGKVKEKIDEMDEEQLQAICKVSDMIKSAEDTVIRIEGSRVTRVNENSRSITYDNTAYPEISIENEFDPSLSNYDDDWDPSLDQEDPSI